MKTIKMTRGFEAIVDDEDFEFLNQLKWHANPIGKRMYAQSGCWDKKFKKKYNIRMHRFLLKPKSNEQVDHINGNGLDNRRCNLRILSRVQNLRAFNIKRKLCSSIYRGVFWHKGHQRWLASICFNSKAIYVGVFKSENEAALAWNKKALELGFFPEALNVIPTDFPLKQKEFHF